MEIGIEKVYETSRNNTYSQLLYRGLGIKNKKNIYCDVSVKL